MFLVLVPSAVGFAVRNDAGPDLMAFLALQRLHCPSATISGTFYDWRAVSQYRSTAGMHLGYDIAMPAGTRVVVGWPGQVTRVAAWLGPEHGITVVSPSGYETTYGHLVPRVHTGDVLNAGDTVGTVVRDHVDVKMRGPDGAYYDFGHGRPPAGAFVPLPQPSRGDVITSFKSTWLALGTARQTLQATRIELTAALASLEDARLAAARAQAPLPDLRQMLADGGVSHSDVARAEAAARIERGRVEASELQVRVLRLEVEAQGARLDQIQQAVAATERALAGYGVSPREIAAMRTVAPEIMPAPPDPAGIAAAREELATIRQLYEMGAVPRADLDRAQQRVRALSRNRASASKKAP